MGEKFQDKYRIPSNRLQGFDYGSHGLYFITICTKNKIHYFGEIVETHIATHNVETGNCSSPDMQTNDNETWNDTHNKTGNCPSLPHGSQPKTKQLQPTDIGKIAFDFWKEIPNHYPFVVLEEFVIMPNHIHGILFFNKPYRTDWTPNVFGIQSQNLGAVLRAYKSSVKRYANENGIEFEWQTRFHDHIIRDENEQYRIKNYIIHNPQNWDNDKLNDNASP